MEIPPYNYREKTHFYGQYKDKLLQLEEPYYLKIRIDYMEALFFLGKYSAFLKEVRFDLHYVIDNNIFHFEGKDVYRWLLTLKGAALYNTEQYEQAANIFKQLSRIYPTELKLKWYLFRSVYQRQRKHVKWLFVGYGFILTSIVLLSVAELFIGMKWPDLLHLIKDTRNDLLLGGSLFILFTISWSIFRAVVQSWRLLNERNSMP